MFKDILDFSNTKTKKFVLMAVYSIITLVAIYYFFIRRSQQAPILAPARPAKKEDMRPRVSITGTLITPETLNTLLRIGRYSRLYLVFRVMNSDEEEKIKHLLEDVVSLAKHRILFCETEIGYKALLRQLNPQLHIEENLKYAREMSGYLNAIAIVTDQECDHFYQIIEFKDSEGLIINILKDLR